MLEYAERRVLLQLAKGFSLQQIADREGVTLQYLKTNILPSLYRKLGAANAAEAVAQGFVQGYIIDDNIPKKAAKTGIDHLTENELRVCWEANSGESTREVAKRLNMSDSSVRSLLQKARNKSGLTTKQLAQRCG